MCYKHLFISVQHLLGMGIRRYDIMTQWMIFRLFFLALLIIPIALAMFTLYLMYAKRLEKYNIF